MAGRATAQCRCLVEFVDDAEKMAEPLGIKDPTDFIRRGLELDHG
jgi:hypothetical protein